MRLFPRPRAMAYFVMLLCALAFLAGWIRSELLLTLLGTVFLFVLLYCFLGVLISGILQRGKARSLSISILTETVSIASLGDEVPLGELLIKSESRRFLRLPAILVRCQLCLETMDGRLIRHYADPGLQTHSYFPVKERGAYYGERDRFLIFDAPGFFCLSLPIPPSGPGHESHRLLALPAPAEEPIPLSLKYGGSEARNETHYLKSDELTDHRPYVPGDDPRRINWKLYSHAPQGDLFVREGEPLPPPHSRLCILIDTEADRILYTLDEGRRAVDLLCENALAAALEFSRQGMEISLGYTGGKVIAGPMNAAELSSALARPAAIYLSKADLNREKFPGETFPRENLPRAPENGSVLILALPRVSSANSALDRFIENFKAGTHRTQAELIFLYDAESKLAAELEDTTKFCVNLYRGKSGIIASGRAGYGSRGWGRR
ncbi:MAG: DUF58 domain-containing protein [Treponema sp.]|nr:DUF58 domain-containing protein [Treponema sp.]